MRNDLTIYDRVADQWWSDEVRWVRTLKNLVPGRMRWFERHFDWLGKDVLDLGCAGGFMAEAMAVRGARVTGIDPAAKVVAAARRHSSNMGLTIQYDVGVGEALPYDDVGFDAVVCVDVLEHVADLNRRRHRSMYAVRSCVSCAHRASSAPVSAAVQPRRRGSPISLESAGTYSASMMIAVQESDSASSNRGALGDGCGVLFVASDRTAGATKNASYERTGQPSATC
jgi:SAM-dependent methyltransferase